MLKKIASKLPGTVQNELKRLQFARELRVNRFTTDEHEFKLLDQWLDVGDWALDIGANVRHYMARMSELVGAEGRVIAFEPVPATFELLAANVARLRYKNVTLLNVAASSCCAVVGIRIPKFDTGLDNYYMAHLTDEGMALQCITLAVDALHLPTDPAVVKIDAEGYEAQVLQGMSAMLERAAPVMVIENNSRDIALFMTERGYTSKIFEGSSNIIFTK